jgi:hypothetical protein
MSDMILISPLSKADAQELIQTVRFHLYQADRHENIARQAALRFQKQEGWRVLGYPNLRECFVQELGVSWQHGYRLIQAAEVDQNLSEFSPIGENITIPESHARHLAQLPAEKQIVALDRADSMAAAEGVTRAARHVEKAVEGVKTEIALQDNPVIARAVAAQEITPTDGLQIKRQLDALPPSHQAKVMEIITEHGLRDARLVVPLAEMAMRPEGRESKVFETIERTGHVGGVPLREASLADLKNEKSEAREEHIAESIEAKRQRMIDMGLPVSEQVVVTLYTNNPAKNCTNLVRALPLDDLKAVAELLMQHVINEIEKAQVEI